MLKRSSPFHWFSTNISKQVSICLLCLLVITTQAQDDPTSNLIDVYTNLAEDFAADGFYDSAAVYYQKLAAVYLEEGEIIYFIFSHIDAAFLYTSSGQYAQAIELLHKAIQLVDTPHDPDEQWAFLWLHIHLGHNQHQIGSYLEAKKAYEAALLNFIGDEHRDFDIANYLYRPLGNIYTRLGAHQQAFKLLDRFKEISIESEQYNAAAEAFSDIGILFYDQREYLKAIKHYQEALKLPAINDRARALVLSNLAGAYMELKQFQKAIDVSGEAFRLFNSVSQEDDNRVILAYKSGVQSKLAHAYLYLNQYTSARNHFEKALELSHKAYGSFERREAAKIYLGLGQLNLALQNPGQALRYYQKTLQAVLPGISDDPGTNPPQSSLFAENSLMEALNGKALAYQQQFAQANDPQLLNEALKCYELIFEVEAKLRQNFQFESSKLFQVNESHQRSEKALDLAFQLYQNQPDIINFERALQLSERARSVVLKESLQDSKAQNFAGIPDSVHTYEKELKINLSLLRKALLQQDSTDGAANSDINSKKEQIFKLEQAQKQLVTYLEKQYPAYYKLKYQPKSAPTISELRSKLLANNDIVIEYFVGENSIYVFKITPNEIDFVKVANDFDLQHQVELTLGAIRDFQSTKITTYEQLAHQLYEKLLGPLDLNPGQSLLIVPDGILSHLPFAALIKHKSEQLNYKLLPYLIRDHAINYAYSLALVGDDQDITPDIREQKSFLGVAPIYENSSKFLFLNHSADEIERISKTLDGDRLLGNGATKEKFLAMADDYQLIHISSHAQALDSLSVYSWISFSDYELPNEDDHKLYLSEIYALRIPAELIILGACETGTGELNNGEGVMSLARGFIHAGCQSVVTTLWPVSNNATNQIMSNFYGHLVNGVYKHSALRQSQLDYLEDGNTDGLGAHPFFWAGYVSVGNTNPIEVKSHNPFNLVILGALLLVLGFAFWKYQTARVKQT